LDEAVTTATMTHSHPTFVGSLWHPGSITLIGVRTLGKIPRLDQILVRFPLVSLTLASTKGLFSLLPNPLRSGSSLFHY